MLEISRFNLDRQVAAVDIGVLYRVVVIHLGNICPQRRDDGCNLHQLARLVQKLDGKLCSSSRLDKAAGDDAGENAATRILVGGLTSGFAMSYRSFRDQVNSTRSENEYIRYPERKRPRDIGRYPTDSSWLDDFAGEDGYKILLCHHPEYWSLREPMLRDKRIDLVLSGHAHGGQWRILGRGVYAPGQGILPKYTSGVHYGPYGSLIVSRGLDNPYRKLPRWGNPCEVIFIHFQ